MAGEITTTIPVRNGQQFILQTLESLARQTLRPHRVIVLDNCSTDATPDIVRNFKTLPIEYIRNPRDLGLFGNLNRCLEFAVETEYLHILHADDLIKPEFYSRMTSILQDCDSRAMAWCLDDRIDDAGKLLSTSGNADGAVQILDRDTFLARKAEISNQAFCATLLKTSHQPAPAQFPTDMPILGEHPILWHVMRVYAKFGCRRFILCLGFRADLIKDYIANFHLHNTDCTIKLKTNEMVVHEHRMDLDWEVTLAYTGEKNMTGSRVAQAARKYLGPAEYFAVTYGDGVTDANLTEEWQSHLKAGKLGTVLGVNPPSRFGEIKVDGDQVMGFAEKPDIEDHWINGGFFFFKRDFCNYLSEAEDCVLEREPLVRLARDGQLAIYRHRGFWACMDTQRDREYLTKIVEGGNPPWLK